MYRCAGVGRFTPHSCRACGNSLPCPECGDTSGSWQPGYRQAAPFLLRHALLADAPHQLAEVFHRGQAAAGLGGAETARHRTPARAGTGQELALTGVFPLLYHTDKRFFQEMPLSRSKILSLSLSLLTEKHAL